MRPEGRPEKPPSTGSARVPAGVNRRLPAVLLLFLLAALAAGCGVSLLDGSVPSIPVIQSFTATPAALPADGGAVHLAWTVQGTVNALGLEPGIGDVTGYSAADVTVTVSTTYQLTASNYVGAATSAVTVTVGP
jgi:hypothetical protein